VGDPVLAFGWGVWQNFKAPAPVPTLASERVAEGAGHCGWAWRGSVPGAPEPGRRRRLLRRAAPLQWRWTI